jgi:uncharacterized protein (DUF3084 family)
MALSLTPKTLITASVALLAAAGVFGFLNTQKAKNLRANLATVTSARDDIEKRIAAERKNLKDRETAAAAATVKVSDHENRVAKAEADLVQLQSEKADLQNKLKAAQEQVTRLQTEVEQAGAKPADNPGAPSVQELQAQLDDARRQLESAERENSFLGKKMETAQDRTDRTVQVEDERRRRGPALSKAGVRGVVLAVNQAYNFVVLNLGGRQGVEPNSEMLVFRDGTCIGKLRVSSVEPATAIGDIMTNSLARGVQVQPGDVVVYAGTNS